MMAMNKNYKPAEIEPQWQNNWQQNGIYHFLDDPTAAVYSIDTPPPTVSGHLHLGHVYSYSHADFMARYFRMKGFNVFYPMGFDDNGLPTERLVEKRQKISAVQVGRKAFIEKCLEVSEEAEKDYRALWQRLGLSIDWRYTYRSIDTAPRRISQRSFIDLYHKGLVYRKKAPAIWCPECQTAIAQAELNDLERTSEFVTLPFKTAEGSALLIATTRPELLAACVAVFVHPEDSRYRQWIGQTVIVPHYGQQVPVMADTGADPTKGTGAVMCCTFGDQADVAWWQSHQLPLIEAIDRQGKMAALCGEIAGLAIPVARQRIKQILEEEGLLLSRQSTVQSVRVHERCDTPVEFIIVPQWFIKILESKDAFLALGDQVRWFPDHMHARYRTWVENLNWDWCISRQRYFGIPFPVWYCDSCGEVVLSDADRLPVDPLSEGPGKPCKCGSTHFTPETDVMDTWATSSMSPQIISQWLENPELMKRVFPASLRPQAHEIIRTWAFYTIVKSYYHFGTLPWKDVLISGWGLAGEGMGKISKSRGGGPMPPLEMIDKYSADAVRYWAASTSTGKDSVISEEKIQMGGRLATKLWNVARFSESFLSTPVSAADRLVLTPADRWILASTQRLIQRVSANFEQYEYSAAKGDTEDFFWHDLADNYIEMAKQRLYSEDDPARSGAVFALSFTLNTVLKLFAPVMPYVTEAIYQSLFAAAEGCPSIHRSRWPDVLPGYDVPDALAAGALLVEIATAVRRYKSEKNLSLGSELARLVIISNDSEKSAFFSDCFSDLRSITRARKIEFAGDLAEGLILLRPLQDGYGVAIEI